MKHTAISLVLFSGMCSCASAAEVEMYGYLDLGPNYLLRDISSNLEGVREVDHEGSLTMKAGQLSGSRFGLRGNEMLAGNSKVGFVLEMGINPDTGESSMGEGSLFGRESQLYVQGDYGKLSFGRVSSIAGIYGSFALFHPIADNMWGGWSTYNGTLTRHSQSYARMNNTVTYVSPEYAGWQLSAQHSFDVDGQEDPESSRNNRYSAVGVTFKRGPLQMVATADLTKHDDSPYGSRPSNLDDGYTLKAGGNYDCDFVKLSGGIQWIRHSTDFLGVNNYFVSKLVDVSANKAMDMIDQANGFKGYTVMVGTEFPLEYGTLKFQYQYSDASSEEAYASAIVGADASLELKSHVVTASFVQPLSKKTSIYYCVGVDHAKFELDGTTGNGEIKDRNITAMLSLTHWL